MPYKLKVSGKVRWRGQFRLPDGKTKQKLCNTRAEAAAWEDEQRATQQAPPPPSMTHSTLLDWANAYLADAIRHTPKTVNEKRNVFRRLFQALAPTMGWSSLSRKDAMQHLQAQFQERSGYAANKERKHLAAAWAWGQDFLDDFPSGNPWKTVRKFPEERHPRYVPSELDFWKVVEVAQGQDRVLLLAMLYTAARKGELYRLTWQDVDFGRSQVRLGTRKRADGSMEYEWIPLEDELYNVLLQHRQQAVNEWVFVQAVGRHRGRPYTENRDFPQALCRLAGVREFGCHAIRHLTASILSSAGTPVKMIQEILRHKRLTTTDRYVKNLESVRPHLQVLRRQRTSSVHSSVQTDDAPQAVNLRGIRK